MREPQLFELAEQYRILKEESDTLLAERARIGDKLVAELQRRDLKSLEGHDFKVTLSEPETVKYDDDKGAKVLGKRWLKVSRRTVDRDKLHMAVQEGVVSVDELERFSIVTQKKPYVTVTPAKERAE